MTQPRVLVFGTFDHFHPGHHFLLSEASKKGDLWVVIARDRNVERIKGFVASDSEKKRLENVQTAFPNAHVVLGNPTDFLAPLREISPDLIVLGYDQRLPPGVTEKDFGSIPVERLPAHEPDKYKSSLFREKKR